MPLKTLISWFLCLAVLPLSAQRHRRFDPETDVSLEFRKGAVVVEAPAGAHLKGAFMAVKLKEGAKGTLKVGPLPATNAKDELGDGIWHGPVVIPVKGELPHPSALVLLRDLPMASAFLNGKLDTFVAAVTGDVQIWGQIDKVDALALVLDRIPKYLNPAT